MEYPEFFHELWYVDGVEPFMVTASGAGRLFLWSDPATCPACLELMVRTSDTEGRDSMFVMGVCNPPTQPVICQQ